MVGLEDSLRTSRGSFGWLFTAAVWLASATGAPAQTTPAVLFQNVRVFDGTGAALSPPSNVLVRGNTIAQISTAPIAAADAGVIDGGGRVLMPGLIDAHWHAMFAGLSPADPMANDPGYASLAAAAQASATLMRGFTTVRDRRELQDLGRARSRLHGGAERCPHGGRRRRGARG